MLLVYEEDSRGVEEEEEVMMTNDMVREVIVEITANIDISKN